MLSKAENELLTNTDRGTPMGELFRRFWLPVALAEDLPGADGAPVRVRILGEDLVAFRDTAGRIGLVGAYCAHRGAPLFFGRNEEQGLRCVYHGWKYDVAGRCVDLPNAPEGETYKDKISIDAYACVEAGDLVWAYMGPPEKRPPFPQFEWLNLPKSHRYVKKFHLGSNFMQGLEGDLDPTHGAFLHMTLADFARETPSDAAQRSIASNAAAGRWLTDPAVFGRLEDTEAGVFCINSTEQPDGATLATAAPIWQMPLFGVGAVAGTDLHSGNFRVPIDNENLVYFRLRWSYGPIPQTEIDEYEHGGEYYPVLIPGTMTPRDNRGNDYNIDRVLQRNFSYSGIRSFPMQDAAMVENQRGAIADRTREHLTSSDAHIIHIRGRLLEAARLLAQGVEPEAPWHPEAYGHHFESAVAAVPQEAIRLAQERARRVRPEAEARTLAEGIRVEQGL